MRINKLKVEILMAEKQIAQKEIAASMGVSPNCVSGILRRASTKPMTAGRLAAALGVSVAEIAEA